MRRIRIQPAVDDAAGSPPSARAIGNMCNAGIPKDLDPSANASPGAATIAETGGGR